MWASSKHPSVAFAERVSELIELADVPNPVIHIDGRSVRLGPRQALLGKTLRVQPLHRQPAANM